MLEIGLNRQHIGGGTMKRTNWKFVSPLALTCSVVALLQGFGVPQSLFPGRKVEYLTKQCSIIDR